MIGFNHALYLPSSSYMAYDNKFVIHWEYFLIYYEDDRFSDQNIFEVRSFGLGPLLLVANR